MTKNTAEFVVGDIVKLNAGGPDMSVKEIFARSLDSNGTVYRCQWFAGKKLDWGDFKEDGLVLVKKQG